jgi:ribosome-binding factor A
MKHSRQERIAEEIRREVSQAIHFQIADVRLEGVSITGVKMTPDLRLARVYFTISKDPSKGKNAVLALRQASYLLKQRLAKNLSLKYVPNFDFFYDESFELQERIDALFYEIEQKKNSVVD